jgi:hypothetical protein
MTDKIERKKLIIREYDYKKLVDPKRRIGYYEEKWDRIAFEPITKEYFRKQASWFLLKGDKKSARIFQHYDYPSEVMSRLPEKLMHDKRYPGWLLKYDEAGVLQVRASIGQRCSRVGWAIFERDVKEVVEDDSVVYVYEDA